MDRAWKFAVSAWIGVKQNRAPEQDCRGVKQTLTPITRDHRDELDAWSKQETGSPPSLTQGLTFQAAGSRNPDQLLADRSGQKSGPERETSMHGQEERYERSDDNLARLIVYFGPYLLWGAMGALVGGLFLLS